MNEVPELFLDTIESCACKDQRRVSVHGEVFSPFTALSGIVWLSKCDHWAVKNKDKVKAVLERLADASLPGRVRRQKGSRCGADFICFCRRGFISPKMYAEYVLPYERRVTDAG